MYKTERSCRVQKCLGRQGREVMREEKESVEAFLQMDSC